MPEVKIGIIGFTPPRRGRVRFKGQDITGASPDERARMGQISGGLWVVGALVGIGGCDVKYEEPSIPCSSPTCQTNSMERAGFTGARANRSAISSSSISRASTSR